MGSNPIRSTVDFFEIFLVFFEFLLYLYIKYNMANISENKKYHFIYKTINLINNDFYIGMHSTSNLSDGYLGSGKRLTYSVRKYGAENFKCEILEFLSDRESLIKREIELVTDDLIKEDKCINLKPGGQGGLNNKEHEISLHLGASKYLKEMWMNIKYRQKHSEYNGQHMIENHKNGKIKYDTFTGKKHKIETINKMKEKGKERIGDKNSQFGTCWINNGIENKKIKREDKNNFLDWEFGRLPIGNIGINQYKK